MPRAKRASRSGSVPSEASEEPVTSTVEARGTEMSVDSNTIATVQSVKADIPNGRPKSGRFHKTKQATRTSLTKSTTARKTYETHKAERDKYKAMKALEKDMKAEKDQKPDHVARDLAALVEPCRNAVEDRAERKRRQLRLLPLVGEHSVDGGEKDRFHLPVVELAGLLDGGQPAPFGNKAEDLPKGVGDAEE